MTPLVLVVGFLGSGKTTFLKQLVPLLAAEGVRPGLLINDYQNADIDAGQFRELIEGVRALSGDCACCGSRDRLLEELRSFEHAPGRVMLVETNGTTDSGRLIEALSLDRTLQKFTLPVQLSLIDAQRWQKRFWHNAFERGQARTASHIFISRRDAVPPARLADVVGSLAKRGVMGRQTDPGDFASELAGMARNPAPRGEVTRHARDHGHEAGHHFASCELPLPGKISRPALGALLRALPPEVIRAKGIAVFEENPGEFFVFQKVDEDIQFFPVGNDPQIKSPLALFIGPRLSVEDLRARINALADTARPK